ncbi:TPA: hypothetical protein ACKP7Q_000807 [Stenotrophomonas maltophilia]
MLITEKIANYSRGRGVIEVHPDYVAPDACSSSSETERGEIFVNPAAGAPLYNAWNEFLATTGPYTYIWTQSFMHPYSDRKAIEALWDCTKHINRSIWGPRWVKKGSGIHATVVAERHKKSLELRGRLHFHVLVQKPDAEICDEKFISAVKDGAVWLRDDFGKPMSALDRTDVRTVYDPAGLATYLTKDLQTHHWPNGDSIFFLRPGGAEGVVFRAMSGIALNSHH